jgi:hypothetical protein
MANEKALAEFRKKLIEDVKFRHEFAADPADALRSVGIDVPEAAVIPPIDAQVLDDRIEAAKKVLGGDVSKLYDAKSFGTLARDRKTFKRVESLTNIGTRVGSPVLDKSIVYTISAFGTIDW